MELENKVPEQINDIKKENFEKLAQLFPSIIKDGQVDFKALKEELGEFSKEAAKHVLLLRKSSPQLFKKLERLPMLFSYICDATIQN